MTFQKLSPEELRRHKGISFVGISVAIFAYDDNGNILLTKRGKKARDEHGRWSPVAGGLKHGETVEASLERELKEECCVKPITTEFLGYYDVFRSSPDDMPTHWLIMCFATKVDPTLVKIGEPEVIDQIGWFSLDALPSPLHSQFGPFLDKMGGNLRKVLATR